MVAAPSHLLTPRRVALGVLALGVAGVSTALVTVYVQRQAIGVRFALDYLRAHGVPAAIHLDRLDLKGASGSMRLGPWWRPDLVVPHMEMTFRALPVTAKGVGAPQVRALELDHPTLRGAWRDGRLEFGSLQPLIDGAAHAKPSGQPPPDLHIRDGRLILRTPAGQLVLAVDADVLAGHVRDAHLRLEPLDLTLNGLRLAAVQGVAHAEPLGEGRLHLTAALSAERGRGRGAAASGLTLTLEGVAPDSASAPVDGAARAVDASLRVKAGQVALRPAGALPLRVKGADVTLDLDGALDPHNRFAGRVRLAGAAAEVGRGGATALNLKLALASPQATAGPSPTRQGQGPGRNQTPGRVMAAGPFTLDLSAGGGRLASPLGAVALGPMRLGATGEAEFGSRVRIEAHGGLEGSAGLARGDADRLAGRLVGGVDPQAAHALAAALTGARITAPAYTLRYDGGGAASVALAKGAMAAFRNGELRLRPIGASAVLRTGPGGATVGAFAAALRVAGLPDLDVSVPAVSLDRRGISARLALTAAGGFGPVRDAAVRFDGELAERGGVWSGMADRCADVRVGAYGPRATPTVKALSAQLCPADGAPLFVIDRSAWRARAQVRTVAFAVPGVALKAGLARADVALSGGRAAPAGRVGVSGLSLQDTSATPRFGALVAQGGAELGGGAASGRFDLSLAKDAVALGRLTLSADLAVGAGGAVFQGAPIQLAQNGLKPGDIVPALARVLPEADGAIQLDARAAFTRAGLTSSSGEVRTPGLSFKSPAGRIDGLMGTVTLASLLPLRSAPGQALAADKLETLLPLTDIAARFTLEPEAIALESLSADVSGGAVSLDPTTIPLTPGAPLSGVLRLKDVQLQQALSAFNLSNAVTLNAEVDGDLPFTLKPSASGGAPSLRVRDGRVYADRPGRLTIQRQALGGAVATANGSGAQPNAVQDFAYQALENLAFTTLEASVASRPEGRLGVVFHVVGRHDPKLAKPTRVGLFQLLRGHAFDKPLPLPKGTPVDLTLDTSLNLDDLLASYAALNGSSGSGKVQP